MGLSLGLGKNKNKSSNKTTFTPNDTTASLFNPLFSSASDLLSQPAQAYTADLSAGLNDTQQGARDLFTPGVGQDALQSAISGATGLTGYHPQQISGADFSAESLAPFMNPYEDQVVQGALGDVERQRAQAINDTSGGFTKAGAWGGSRHGVADSLTNEAALRTAADTASRLRQGGYDRATGLQMGALTANQSADLSGANLRQSGSGLLGSLAQQQQGMGLTDVNAMNELGTQEQATQQADLDRAYQEFLRLSEDPLKRAQAMQGLIGSIPALFSGATQKGNSKGSGSTASFGASYGS